MQAQKPLTCIRRGGVGGTRPRGRHMRLRPSEAGDTGWFGPGWKSARSHDASWSAKAYRRQNIGLFPVAVRVASLRLIAEDDTILRGASYADMLSLFSRRAGAVPSTRAPTWSARTKDAGADLCGRYAASPSRAASALIANMAHFEQPPRPPSPCMRFSLGAPRSSRPPQA